MLITFLPHIIIAGIVGVLAWWFTRMHFLAEKSYALKEQYVKMLREILIGACIDIRATAGLEYGSLAYTDALDYETKRLKDIKLSFISQENADKLRDEIKNLIRVAYNPQDDLSVVITEVSKKRGRIVYLLEQELQEL